MDEKTSKLMAIYKALFQEMVSTDCMCQEKKLFLFYSFKKFSHKH